MDVLALILAAGQGTRMRSALPKVLHRIGGVCLLEHVYRLAGAVQAGETAIVYGHGAEQTLGELGHLSATWIEQKERKGTGHAVMQAADRIRDDVKVLILYGDVPLLKQETVETLLHHASGPSLGLLTVVLDNPTGYGRIIRDDTGKVLRIVEEKDASAEERAVREVNTGILAVEGGPLKRWLKALRNDNAQGEYYLTDVVGLAVAEGYFIDTSHPAREEEVLGVNNRQQLAELERAYQSRRAADLMERGVTLRDPARFDLRGEIAALGRDVEIDVNVVLEGNISLGDNVRIGPHVCLKDAVIGNDVEILAHSVIEGAVVGAGSRIGPFARLRPDSVLAEAVHVGNFVEIKKSDIATGSKVNHLSYIGDASIGAQVNVGAGTITCNYDGVNKHRTVIEDGAFIGSDTQLVAPVRVGRNATIGAGSTITKDTPEERLTLSRAKQLSIEGWKRPEKTRK
ncbi:MAG: bifunctional UDP-N-acetylglucosamine diphosphorylase/glucosamine-1-phosphate N-acetyltransferase GlmU [Methylococcus sp.]|nr:bifunctional UDP-N-acetylglucosamine diphosphorylase/glucosamine-1-phosphate N-acetyltransferase GlmU [Methylococcus sp.]